MAGVEADSRATRSLTTTNKLETFPPTFSIAATRKTPLRKHSIAAVLPEVWWGVREGQQIPRMVNSPLTGVTAADPARPSKLTAPGSVPFRPDAVRLKSLNPLRVKSAVLEEWWGGVRGRKCLQRQDLMFKRIWLRPDDDNDDGDDRERRWEEPVRSEVLVCEVLVPEWRSGGLPASGSGSGSESRQMGSAV